jgi:hypothetical protein
LSYTRTELTAQAGVEVWFHASSGLTSAVAAYSQAYETFSGSDDPVAEFGGGRARYESDHGPDYRRIEVDTDQIFGRLILYKVRAGREIFLCILRLIPATRL